MIGKSHLLGGIYRCPSSSVSNNDNLIDSLNNVGENKASHNVIIGDFNWRRISGMMVVVFCLIHAQLIITNNVF